MATFEQIQAANATIRTTDIKGKEYAEVNQRIKAFRMVYPDGFIRTHMDSNVDGVCVFSALVGFFDDKGDSLVIGTGTAYEKETSSFINKTSYIENCETSAVGRALGMAGFGIDTSVASAEEVKTAILNQGKDKAEKLVEEAKDESKPVTCPKCGGVILREKLKGKMREPEEILKACGGMCLGCWSEKQEQKKKKNEGENS